MTESEYARLKAQADEIVQREREALERPLLAEIDSLKLELHVVNDKLKLMNSVIRQLRVELLESKMRDNKLQKALELLERMDK